MRPLRYSINVTLDGCCDQLKRESGKGLFVGGVKLPRALAEVGLIDELKLVSRLEFGSGTVAIRAMTCVLRRLIASALALHVTLSQRFSDPRQRCKNLAL